jgi:hypothetical protein
VVGVDLEDASIGGDQLDAEQLIQRQPVPAAEEPDTAA